MNSVANVPERTLQTHGGQCRQWLCFEVLILTNMLEILLLCPSMPCYSQWCDSFKFIIKINYTLRNFATLETVRLFEHVGSLGWSV